MEIYWIVSLSINSSNPSNSSKELKRKEWRGVQAIVLIHISPPHPSRRCASMFELLELL